MSGFEHLLNTAPCDGPFNFKLTDATLISKHLIPGSSLHPDNFNWCTGNRWENYSDYWFDFLTDSDPSNDFDLPNGKNGDFFGLDYMLLFNLFCLNNPGYLNSLGGYSFNAPGETVEITGLIPVPPNNLFTHISPGYAYSYDKMNVHAWIQPNGHLEAKATNEIHLTNGFTVEPGGYFHGYIAPPECVNGVYKSANAHISDSALFSKAYYRVYPKTYMPQIHQDQGNQPQGKLNAHAQTITNDLYGGLMVYPNPTNESIQLIIANPVESLSQITIFNNPGQVLYKGTENGNQFSVDVSSFADGHYFIQMKNDQGQWVKPFVVKR